jgi:hypothetical protein
MSRGFGLKPPPGAASQRSQNGLFRGKHDLSLKNIGAPTSHYMPPGPAGFAGRVLPVSLIGNLRFGVNYAKWAKMR